MTSRAKKRLLLRKNIKKKEFITGSTGGQDAATVYTMLLNNMIGTKFKVLAGQHSHVTV